MIAELAHVLHKNIEKIMARKTNIKSTVAAKNMTHCISCLYS